jgi:hypothetical protein
VSTCIWWGRAKKTAQINTVTPANVNIGNTFTITLNSKAVTVTATAATVLNVTALLVAAFNASEEPEFEEITATDSTTHVTLTADDPGKPFTQTSSASGGTATNTTATTTANTSPNDWNNANNWSGGSVPITGDTVILADSDVDILWSLDQNAVLLAVLKRLESYTGTIGLPYTTGTDYREYRETTLKIGITSCYIEQPSSDETDQIKWNPGTDQTAITIVGRNTSASIGNEALRLTGGTHASNVITVTNGSVAVAVGANETATQLTTTATNSTVRFGVGVTWTTISQQGGEIQANSGGTTYRLTGDSPVGTVQQAAAITTLDVQAGTVYDHGTGTVGTVTIGSGATIDRRGTNVARTYTNIDMAATAALYGMRTLTFTDLDLINCGIADVTLDLGDNIKLTRANL